MDLLQTLEKFEDEHAISSPESENDAPDRLKNLVFKAMAVNGNSLLHRLVLANTDPGTCARQNFLSAVLRCLTGDVIVNKFNQDGDTALHLAVKRRNNYMLERMITCIANFDVHAKTRGGETAMNLAVHYQFLDGIHTLLLHNVNVNEGGRWGLKPLHYAVMVQNFLILKLLLDKGGGATLREKDLIESPLHLAVQADSLDIIKTLIFHGVDLNARSNCGYTPLHDAIIYKTSEQCLKILLENGADVHATTTFRAYTALHLAAREGYHDLVELLISFDANVNGVSSDNETPLHRVTSKRNLTVGHRKVIETLTSNGADINLQNKNGESPISLLRKNGNQDIVKELTQNKRRRLE